jgi:hypothetical protein
MQSITIDRHYRGPPPTADTCAVWWRTPWAVVVKVTLRAPAPLGQPVAIVQATWLIVDRFCLAGLGPTDLLVKGRAQSSTPLLRAVHAYRPSVPQSAVWSGFWGTRDSARWRRTPPLDRRW